MKLISKSSLNKKYIKFPMHLCEHKAFKVEIFNALKTIKFKVRF